VWSYTVGAYTAYIYNGSNCPRGPSGLVLLHLLRIITVVSGNPDHCGFDRMILLDQTHALWDGQGCPTGDDCCVAFGAPWFFLHLIYITEPEISSIEESITMNPTLM